MNTKRLIQTFLFLCFVALVMLWQVFSGYSDSSTVKKEKYLFKYDLSKLVEGEVRIVRQAGLPIILMRRSKQDLKNLLAIRSSLLDSDSKRSTQPQFAKNYHRSLKPEYFIAYAVSPKTGRDIFYRLDTFNTPYNVTEQWFGGFSESSSANVYDKAGRVYQSPNSRNLDVPNYKINAADVLYVYALKELDFD